VFSLQKPSESFIRDKLEAARNLPLTYSIPFVTEDGSSIQHPTPGFSVDHTRSEIGHGESAFATAKAALQQWQQFDLGWVRVANPDAKIAPDQLIAVEAHTIGLWSINISRIVYVIDEDSPGQPRRFGFAYGTTPLHVESGEERFLVELDPVTGGVSYDLLAISRPAHWLVRLGYPFTRSQQHRFARDSHSKMKHIAMTSTRLGHSAILTKRSSP
jgi:uncharacterized protein (UPF0548 family)